MWLKEEVRIWGLYTILMWEKVEEKEYLQENKSLGKGKWTLRKIDRRYDSFVTASFQAISYPSTDFSSP